MRYNIKIKTLTSIHIGNGEKLTPDEYLIKKNRFHRLDIDKIYSEIFDRNPDYADKFNDWVNDKIIEAERQVKQKSNSEKRLDVFSFISDKLHNNELKKDIEDKVLSGEFSRYILPASTYATKEVHECIKTGNDEVYLPGTTIKGMLRTALMNDIIFNEKKDTKIKKEIEKALIKGTLEKLKDKQKKDLSKWLEEYIFTAGYNYRGNIRYGDAKYDIFKFIKVSDSDTKKTDEVCHLAEVQLLKYHGKLQGQLPLVEAINNNIEFSAVLEIDVKGLREVAKKVQTTQLRKDWIGFENLIKRCFNITIDALINGSNNEIAKRILGSLLLSIENFSTAIINQDYVWWNNIKGAKKIIEKFKKYPESALKLGWGGGFPSKTIYTTLTDEEFYNNNIEKSILSDFFGDNEFSRFPKTRTVEIKDKNNYSPFGWIELIIE